MHFRDRAGALAAVNKAAERKPLIDGKEVSVSSKQQRFGCHPGPVPLAQHALAVHVRLCHL